MVLFPSFQEQNSCSSSAPMNIKLYVYGWSQTSLEDSGDSIIMFSASTLPLFCCNNSPKWVLLIGSSSTSGSTALMGSSWFLFIYLKFSLGSGGSGLAVSVAMNLLSSSPFFFCAWSVSPVSPSHFWSKCRSSFRGCGSSLGTSCLLPVFMMSLWRSELADGWMKQCWSPG